MNGLRPRPAGTITLLGVSLLSAATLTSCGLNPSMDWRPGAYAEKACVGFAQGTEAYAQCYADAYMSFHKGAIIR